MKRILILALLALSFSACKKNDSAPKPIDPPRDTNNPASDKKLVDSVITYEGKGSTTLDYNYDNKNRLTDMHARVVGGAFGDIADHVYTYDDQDNLIKSVITRNSTSVTFNYIYKNNVPIKVTYTDPSNANNAHTIIYTTINSAINQGDVSTPSGETSSTTYTYHDQNKINETGQSKSPSGDITYIHSFDNEYGDKKNPYLYTGSKWLLPDVEYANKNDLLKQTYNNNNVIYISLYANTYDDNGYPIKVVEKRASTQGMTEITTVYKYIDAK